MKLFIFVFVVAVAGVIAKPQYGYTLHGRVRNVAYFKDGELETCYVAVADVDVNDSYYHYNAGHSELCKSAERHMQIGDVVTIYARVRNGMDSNIMVGLGFHSKDFISDARWKE